MGAIIMNKKQHALNQKLDSEENDLLDSFERGEWKKSDDSTAEMAFAKKASDHYFRKDARINIRLTQHDLVKLKQLAAYEGMPYQTLIGSLLHKYALGHLKFA